jgi:methyl-accepting chemotaxis protein
MPDGSSALFREFFLKEGRKEMSFIDDMKIGKKMVGGFLIVVLILIVVAAIGYTNLTNIGSKNAEMYNDRTVPIDQLGIVSAETMGIRGDIYKYILLPDERAVTGASINKRFLNMEKQMDLYSATSLTPEEKTSLAEYNKVYPQYKAEILKIVGTVDAGDTKYGIASVTDGGTVANLRKQMSPPLDAMLAINVEEAKKLNTDSVALVAGATMTMIISTIVGVIIAIAIALYLTRSITGPIGQVASNLKELQKGHLSVRLNLSRKDEIGDMARTMDRYASGQQKWVLGTMQKIAEGDLSSQLKAADAQDEVVPALQTTIDSIRALVAEANMLSKAAIAGQLSTRGNADKFKGGYRDIVSGVNQTLDSVVGPVNEAMRVSNEYAQGNFTARVDEKLDVQGDFIRFKQALNNIGIEVAKALSAINRQVGDLAASAEEANASVEEVSAGSAQVAKNASGVSVNAEKATQGVEQVQKALEDLSHTIQDVATKSEMVAKLVQDTTDFSREGMELAQKTEKGMQGITRSSSDVNQIIGEIKDQMDKISEIVGLITDLANQTNLLALNAAIEAARAGDAGRGFAVVATEVKSLAVESRASAERIAGMIDNLQKQTLNAVDAVMAANTGVKEGSAALVETLSSFNKIVTSIDKISQNVSEVAAAAEEQAASVQEVTASVSEVGGLMQSTTREATDAAAASEESSAAIDQITKVVANVNSIVDKVTREVSRFRV